MSNIVQNLFTTMRSWIPQVTTVRYRYHADKIKNGPIIKRYGYKEKIDQTGLLSRKSDKRVIQIPFYRPANPWAEKRAFFGQNDYIDILGNDNLHPTKILYNIPAWLRGVRGNEYQVLLRKTNMLKRGIFPRLRPTKWKEIQKRIRWLYKFLNRKTRTGMWEKY